MDVKALQQRLRDFAAERHWQPYHVPKNLAMALLVEAAELLELFQWQTLSESRSFTRDRANQERVADEIADVLLYLVQLADHTGVDIEQAVEHKLRKNAEKHPAKGAVKQPMPAPTAPEKPQTPKVHLLVDWENVQPSGEALQALLPEGSDAWLFHGPQQKIDTSSHQRAYGAENVTCIPRTGSGKNALDFQLSYYVGYIAARQPEACFVVVSNDQGYEPMLEHARELGFDARRIGFPKPRPSAAAAPPKTALPIPATASSPAPTPPTPATPAPPPVAAQAKPKPPTAIAPAKTPAKKTVPAKKTIAKSAPQPATPVKAKPAPTAAQMALAVLASLRKMPNNKPARRAGLLKFIETHTVKAADPKSRAQQVYALLEARKNIATTADGKGVTYPNL